MFIVPNGYSSSSWRHHHQSREGGQLCRPWYKEVYQSLRRGWRDGSVVKVACCSSEGPEFRSPHPYQVAHYLLSPQLQKIWNLLLATTGTIFTRVYRPLPIPTLRHMIKFFKRVYYRQLESKSTGELEGPAELAPQRDVD